MKKLFCSFIICLLGLLAITSCGNDDEKFEGLEFDTQGVILSTRSGNNYYGEIKSIGGDITITAKGKNSINGLLSQFKVNDFMYEVTDKDWQQSFPYTICSKDWGNVELVSKTPYSIRIHLNENNTDNSINYMLTFGGGYKTSSILLTQFTTAR
jgi:hypothetical protein